MNMGLCWDKGASPQVYVKNEVRLAFGDGVAEDICETIESVGADLGDLNVLIFTILREILYPYVYK